MTMLTASASELNALADMGSLRDRVQQNDPDALREVAVQFEALVMNLMLKSARAATPGDGAFDGPNTRQYLEMMDQQVSLALARQGGLGVAKMLGVSPEPFILAVLFGANMSFATPFGYQTNLLILSAGGYKFSDFLRVGIPLTIIMWIGFSLILPVLYEL